MSQNYDLIVKTLHDRGWSPFAAPAPVPTEKALVDGMTVAEIVSRFWNVVENAFHASSFYPTLEQASYSMFRGREYVELDTAIVLGQQHETPVEKIAEARTVEQFLWNLNHGYNRLGFKDGNCGPDSEQGKLRRAAAKAAPAEFVGYEGIWELAVLSGSYQVGLTGFAPAYAQMTPQIHEIRGLDPQQYLDNLWTPGKWRPTQAAK